VQVANLWVGISMDDSRFQAGLREAQTKLEGLKSRMVSAEASSKKLAAGLAVIGAALMAAGLKSVKMAGDLEQTKIAFTTMLGSAEAADAFIRQLYDFAAKTPFEIEGLSTAARQLLAFGFQAEEIIPMMESIGNAVSGLGGGAFEIQRVTRALGQMQAKGKVSAEEMMQLAELGIPVWDILAQKIGVSIPEAMDMASKGAISASQGITALIEGMNDRFPDMMEKQSESLLGIWSNFQDNISQIFTFIGEDIIETFSLKGKLKTVVDSLTQLKDLIAEEGLQGALDRMSVVAKTVIVAIAGAITAALIPAFVALATAIWAAMAPLLPFMAAGAALAALAYLIYNAWSNNMFGIQTKVAAVKNAVAAYFNMLSAEVLLAFNALKAGVFKILEGILNAVKPLVGALGNIAPAFESAFGRAQAAISQKGDAASNEAKKQAEQFKKSAASLADSAGQIKEAFSDWSTPAKQKQNKELADTKSDLPIGQEVAEMAETMAAAGSKGAAAAKEVKAAWEAASDRLKTKLYQVKTAFEITGNQLDMTGTKSQQLKNDIDSLTAQIEVQKQVVAATSAGYEQMKEEKGENSEEAEKLKLKLLEEEKALSDLEKQLYSTKNALKDQAQELRSLGEEVTSVEKKYKEDLVSALEDYQNKVSAVNKKLVEDEASLTKQYKDELETRAKALSNFVGLFDAVTNKDVSGSKLLNNLRSQVDAFENWQENISALAARGIDEGLLQQLREMGPEAGSEIAALNTLTDDQLVEYVSLWKKKNQAAKAEAVDQLQQQRVEMQQKLQEIRATAQEQLEQYRMEWEQKNAEIRKNTEEEMKRIEQKFQDIAGAGTRYGVSLMQNFTSGMESQFDVLRSTLEAAATIVDSYMPHSPAKVGPLKRLGEWGPALVSTFADGIKASLPNLKNAMASMAGMAALTPAAMGPSISSSSTSNNYGGNTFQIYVQGSSTREQADNLMRELAKRGVRF